MSMVVVDAPLFVAWMASDPRVGPERTSLLGQVERPALTQGALVEIASELISGGLALPLPSQLWLELALERSRALLLPLTPAVVARAARWDVPGLDVHDRIAAATAVEHDAEFATWNPALAGLPGVRYFF